MSFHEPYAWSTPKACIGQLGVQETLKNELPWTLYNAWLKPKTWISQLGVQETLKNELPWTLYYAWLKPKTWWIGQLGVQETLKNELPWTLYNAWLKPETWTGRSGVQENPKKWASIMHGWSPKIWISWLTMCPITFLAELAILPPRTWDKALTQNHQQQQQKQCWVVHMLVRGP